jgi:hypothetical protein
MRTLFILFFIVLSIKIGFAQTNDSLHKVQISVIKNKLIISEKTAKSVTTVMDDYKSKVNAVLSKASGTEANKRSAIDSLITIKNNKLRSLLTDEQLKKFVPSSELPMDKIK